MVRVLNTQELPPARRVDAVRAVFGETQVPYLLAFEGNELEIRHAMHHWQLSDGVQMLRTAGTGLRMARGPRELRSVAPERITLSLQVGGNGRDERRGDRVFIRTNELLLTDQSQVHDFSWSGLAECKAVVVDHEQLGLPVDTIRAAIPDLMRSPLYGLVRTHIAALDADGDRLDPSVQDALASATRELVKGLILTAGGGESQRAGVLDGALYSRSRLYISEHLRDRSLTASEVAFAHHVSLRQFYKVWSANSSVPPAEHIVRARLELARSELTRTDAGLLSTSVLAERWGFKDAAQFDREFRRAFGLSAREWLASKQL